MRYSTMKIGMWALAGLTAMFGTACKDVLKVTDPQTFSTSALDDPAVLQAVTNGVEGQLQQIFDDAVLTTELLSDEIEDTSTWIDFADISTGRIRGDWATGGQFSGVQDELLRTRFSAQDAAARLTRVMGADAAGKSKMMAQTKTSEAWADLVNAMSFCESPLVPGGPRAPDTELYKVAITKMTDAIGVATAANAPEWVNFARAGRARANLLAGNFDAALADAQAVPAGFIKQALYGENSSTSLTGNQMHQNRNRSAGLRRAFWSMVDTSQNALNPTPTQFVKDPWSSQPDQRMAVLHPRGRLGVNNSTSFFSIDKYSDRSGPITMTSKREMNLIEAEVYWRKNDFTNAIAALNRNRTVAPASLPAFSPAGLSAQNVFDRLLSERMAELFTEGHRMTDLDRFNLVTSKLGAGRARKLPLSRNEILNNVNMKQGDAKCPAIS